MRIFPRPFSRLLGNKNYSAKYRSLFVCHFTTGNITTSKTLDVRSEGFGQSIIRKEDALEVLKEFLKNGGESQASYRSCIGVVEAEYYKPVLEGEGRCQRFVDGMSLAEKARLFELHLEQTRSNQPTKTTTPQPTPPTTDPNPEQAESHYIRKTLKSPDPRPNSYPKPSPIPPGSKLMKTIALQLRESIESASLPDLCHISKIFTAKYPLSGQVNFDTLELLEHSFAKYEANDLIKHIQSFAKFANRSHQFRINHWSHTRVVKSRKLYRVEAEGSWKFREKVKEVVELHSRESHVGLVAQIDVLSDFVACKAIDSVEVWDRLVERIGRGIGGEIWGIREKEILIKVIGEAKYLTKSTEEVLKVLGEAKYLTKSTEEVLKVLGGEDV